MHRCTKQLKPDIIIVHGFSNPIQLLLLSMQTTARIVIQYNGGGVPGGISGRLQRLTRYFIQHYAFTNREQAVPFLKKGMISANANIYEVLEGSTDKKRSSKMEANQRLNLQQAETVFLWVGTLDHNKDLLTILVGIKDSLMANPKSHLLMIYRTEKLLEAVKAFISQHTVLKEQVHLIGSLPQNELDDYYNCADYFILGSHYEGSGYSLIEAMACGCIPIVTDIPSFRRITDSGNIGILWSVGNVNALQIALAEVLQKDRVQESNKAQHFFERELSFSAIAQQHIRMIEDILSY
jgi:glycosyltransferase involved in cell wall biosynthesis